MNEISFKQKMIISLVSIAPGVINSLVTSSMLVYYTDKLGMDNALLYGIAIIIFGIWNAINNPLIGVYVEHWEPRSGKEKLKGLMKIGIPVMFVGFIIFILAPPGAPDWILFLFLLIGLIIFELGKAIVEVASVTFSIMIVTEPEARSNLVMVMKLVEFVPLALIGIVPIIFLAPGLPFWYALLFILIVNTIMFVMSYLAIFKIHEPEDLFKKVKINGDQDKKSLSNDENERSSAKKAILLVYDSIKSTLNSKSFRILILYRTFGALFQATFITNIYYMINWVIPITDDLIRILFMAMGGVVFNIYYIIQNKLVKRLSLTQVSYIFFAFSFFGYLLYFFATSSVVLFIGYLIANMGTATIYMFSNVMIGDVADNDMVETGEHRYAEFTGNFSVFNSLSPAIATFLVTLILQFSGYDGTSETGQIASAIIGIRIASAILPIIGLILCVWMLKIYPLKGKNYEEMRRKFKNLKS